MRSRSAVSSFRPALEPLETRDLPSALSNLAQKLLPLAQQIAAKSSAALAQLMAADNIRTSILTAASHPTNNSAATTFAQSAAGLQEVLTERRVLEITFLTDLSFFKAGIQSESPARRKSDKKFFAQVLLPQLSVSRSQAIANENAALGLGIVNSGINTIGTPGFVTVTTGINSPVNIDITFPPLRPSLGAGIVTVPVFDYSVCVRRIASLTAMV
jgi:hypothetical protein